jgi:2-polyprenyl-3-methyl-5-hydroxy-6-metoxy-1,4-benzoquinol methylase
VLDIGCSEGWLGEYLPSQVEYLGIDIKLPKKPLDAGAKRRYVECNLDRASIPAGDKQYDLVMCTEVLEHLEEFHFVVNEIARVAKKYAIVSLPNLFNWHFRLATLKGKTTKFYGLPLQKPEDRHRWWFHPVQAEHLFMNHPCFQVLDQYYHYGKGHWYSSWFLNYCKKHQSFPYLLAWHYWVVLGLR